jgi:ribonuclease T1
VPLVLVAVAVLAAACGGSPAGAAPAAVTGCAVRATTVPGAVESKLAVRPLCALPAEAVRTAQLIEKGGPYPYSRDGIVFGNREKLLPAQKSGFYHEFTVPTPGESDRGARRFVTGGTVGPNAQFFYSDDHYGSFSVIDVTATS